MPSRVPLAFSQFELLRRARIGKSDFPIRNLLDGWSLPPCSRIFEKLPGGDAHRKCRSKPVVGLLGLVNTARAAFPGVPVQLERAPRGEEPKFGQRLKGGRDAMRHTAKAKDDSVQVRRQAHVKLYSSGGWEEVRPAMSSRLAPTSAVSCPANVACSFPTNGRWTFKLPARSNPSGGHANLRISMNLPVEHIFRAYVVFNGPSSKSVGTMSSQYKHFVADDFGCVPPKRR
uniref:Uncharacterized protein n=1 Tax=Trichuris muris TaxID=70415 RepID=A0A5S6QVS2_TRIMR